MAESRDVFMVLLSSALMRMETENLTVDQVTDLILRLLDREGYVIRPKSERSGHG